MVNKLGSQIFRIGKFHTLLIKNTNSDSSPKLSHPTFTLMPICRDTLWVECALINPAVTSLRREGMSEEPQVKDSNDNRTVIPKSSIYKCNGKVPQPSNGHSNACSS